MGIKPHEFDAMTYKDFLICYLSYRDQNRKGRGPITSEEDALLEDMRLKWNRNAS